MPKPTPFESHQPLKNDIATLKSTYSPRQDRGVSTVDIRSTIRGETAWRSIKKVLKDPAAETAGNV